MNIIIFEGIASSGKTTIEKRLFEHLSDTKIISESDTLMQLIDNEDVDVAKNHLSQLFEKIDGADTKNIILDRFHITHAFRTKTNVSDFSEIEERLKSFGKVLLILLTIRSEAIRGRIEETMEYRKEGWDKGSRGVKTIKEKVDYYKAQQERLRQLISESTLSHIEVDTTLKDWVSAGQEIMNAIKNHSN